MKPGDKIPMHSHPDHAGYCVGAAKIKITGSDGKEQIAECVDGQVMWIPAGSHTGENVGTTDARVVVIELKK
jgi:quercetin dioxygenase-like cupin family protein